MDQTEKLLPLLKKLRKKSEKQPGFISRTTYSKLSDPGECLVINEWRTVEDWQNWMNSKEAKELQWKVDSIIGEKTSFEIYTPEDY